MPVVCPNCEEQIDLDGTELVGTGLDCGECGVELTITSLDPVAFDYDDEEGDYNEGDDEEYY